MNKKKFILFPLLTISLLISCGGGSEPEVSKQYKVVFNTNGAKQDINDVLVEEGKTVVEPATPEKDHYKFQYWCSDSSLENKYDFSTPVYNNLNLYAKWDINKYTVTFEPMIGTMETKSQSVDYGEHATRPSDPKVEGYEEAFPFLGWFKDINLTEEWHFDTDVVTENITLYASFDYKGCIVVFMSSNPDKPSHYIYALVDNTIKAPTAPIFEGYTFHGWYKDRQCSEDMKWDFDNEKIPEKKAGGRIYLYPKLTINQYTVTFDSQGGSDVPSQTVNYKQTASVPEAPGRTGYNFLGWYKDKECTTEWNFEDPITEDITLYAKWDLKDITVTFNTQDKGITPEKQTVKYGSKITNPGSQEEDPYRLEGWYKEKECIHEWDFSKDTVENNITLYAKWVNDSSPFYNAKWSDITNKTLDELHTTFKEDCDNNKDFEGTLVGLVKDININGRVHQVRVIGENQDKLVDDTSKTAALTFEFVNLVSKNDGNTYTTTYSKNGDTNNYWEGSLLRQFLNNDIYNLFPADLKSGLKKVYKQTYDSKNNKNKDYEETIFPLTPREMGDNWSKYCKEDYKPYSYYKGHTLDHDYVRSKYMIGKKDTFDYWLRSPSSIDSTASYKISWAANTLINSTYTNPISIAPAFCI